LTELHTYLESKGIDCSEIDDAISIKQFELLEDGFDYIYKMILVNNLKLAHAFIENNPFNKNLNPLLVEQ